MQDEASPTRRSALTLTVVGSLALVALAGFVALGTWQLHRLSWKLDLIARVDARVHAAPVALPSSRDWSLDRARADEYRRVTVTGRFLDGRETLVQAVTDLGAGFWVLTPLRTDAGDVVLVNRGFVPPERRDAKARSGGEKDGERTVTGLLRVSEPGGGFLHHNDAAAGRWYSRDTQAIGAAHGLPHVAPFFIDAEAGTQGGDAPIGGLTVVTFRNQHAIYAITWYGLALMVAGAIALLVRDEWRVRRSGRVETHPGALRQPGREQAMPSVR